MPNLSLKIFIKIRLVIPHSHSINHFRSPTSRCGAPEVDISASGAPRQDTSTSPFHIFALLPSLPFSLSDKLASTHASVSTLILLIVEIPLQSAPESLQALGQNPFFSAAQMQISVNRQLSLVFKVKGMLATILVELLVSVQCFA